LENVDLINEYSRKYISVKRNLGGRTWFSKQTLVLEIRF